MSNKLNSESAVVCFGAWVTTRRGTIEVGECHDVAPLAEATTEFLMWNDLGGSAPEFVITKRCMPPRLWFRYTPALGKIEWRIRKFIKDLTS